MWLLVKLWNCPFFKEYYESNWAKNAMLYENVEEFVTRIERKKIFDPFSLIKLRSSGITSYRTIWNNSNVEFLDAFGRRSERRKWIYCIENIKILIYTVSLSEFNLVEYNNVEVMNDSLEMIGKLFGNGLLSDARKVILFTKPDILVKKLQKRMEYSRKINSVVRPELEIISNDYNERIVINSIITEYLERVSFHLDSYHIVNVTSEEEVRSVTELIFDNVTTPFISPCLLPITNRMITTMYNIYLRKLLTDIQIITTINELSP
ncbi:predicted protein [Naegleria gruberi]|uniref:Predicted protein n=1 Tax=Naegleria gruberi TaxID=5762 RepID=D2VBI2_NAEGR|nr:uncharacterized protein NAEGRDRAFT_66226 [Naegleria gruberi]EFC45911.1 predicted protein [Naegleria gruberi]|eukprot:XP_002678655.1 predicted protein [Naegleria gruberi strain NEG-M]